MTDPWERGTDVASTEEEIGPLERPPFRHGYAAHLAFDPEARVSVILLRNHGSGATNPGRGVTGW